MAFISKQFCILFRKVNHIKNQDENVSFVGKCLQSCLDILLNVTKDAERVKNALKLNKKLRIAEFRKMKRDGIVAFNKDEASKENPTYQGERKHRKYFELTRCSSCSAFVSKRFFSIHKKYCIKKMDRPVVSMPINLNVPDSIKLSEAFINKILSKLRNDEIGSICRTDENILLIGSKLFMKSAFKKEKISTVYKSVRGSMRTLGSLYNAFFVNGRNH